MNDQRSSLDEQVYSRMVQQKANILLTMDDKRRTTSTVQRMPIRQRRVESKADRTVQEVTHEEEKLIFQTIEQCIFAKIEHTKLGCFYNATIRFPLYEAYDRMRGKQ